MKILVSLQSSSISLSAKSDVMFMDVSTSVFDKATKKYSAPRILN